MDQLCKHCRNPIEDDHAPDGYCCIGCATVAALVGERGLDRYYKLQEGVGAPVVLAQRARDLAWLEAPLAQARHDAAGGIAQLHVDIQGIRCSACVWLLRELFMRRAGSVDAVINPAVGRALLTFRVDELDMPEAIRDIERFGYRVGPVKKDVAAASDAILARLGICVAITMNTMIFTIAHYVGLASSDGELFVLLRWLNFVLSAVVLVVGGWEFFQRSVHGLRQGILPFDLPISIGLVLGFTGSTWSFFRDPSTFSYFDTLNTFTTLMLVGRWLQERVLEQNRRQLLADDGVDGLFARRIKGNGVETVAATALHAGDELLVPPGNLLVCDGALVDGRGSFSLDWINGESMPREFSSGERVPAGAFNASSSAARIRLSVDFADASLLPLLSRHTALPAAESRDGQLLDRLVRIYVPVVLTLAAAGFLFWLREDLNSAIRVATSVLVVTCPCALGLAIPLAYQRMAAALRRKGVFVCRNGFLDRALRVKRIVFDKTGTLTLGTLKLANPQALLGLSDAMQQLVFNLTSRSSHPRSKCIHDAIPARNAIFDADLVVTEHAGLGLECMHEGRCVRLGAPAWTSQGSAPSRDLMLSLDGEPIARFVLDEQLRWDARVELAAIQRAGNAVHILSGDAPERVAHVATELGLRADAATGSLTPDGKAQWLRDHGGKEDTLFIGDGLNDHPAFNAALACGTPAVDHPAMASRVDFYFVTPGVGAVRTVLDSAVKLQRVVRGIRVMALSYNLVAVGLCLAGVMSPLLAAVAMPASSIVILLYTVRGTRSAMAPRAEFSRITEAAPAAVPT